MVAHASCHIIIKTNGQDSESTRIKRSRFFTILINLLYSLSYMLWGPARSGPLIRWESHSLSFLSHSLSSFSFFHSEFPLTSSLSFSLELMDSDGPQKRDGINEWIVEFTLLCCFLFLSFLLCSALCSTLLLWWSRLAGCFDEFIASFFFPSIWGLNLYGDYQSLSWIMLKISCVAASDSHSFSF